MMLEVDLDVVKDRNPYLSSGMVGRLNILEV
jgi:hypothetical protein